MPSRKILSTLLLVASTVGCHEWRTERLSPEVVTTTPPVRMARVTLVDGRKIEVADPRIASDTFYARSVGYYDPSRSQPFVVPFSHIQRIETRHFNSGQTAGLIVGLAAIALTVFIFATNVSTDTGCVPACN